jgi:hypothetical protein
VAEADADTDCTGDSMSMAECREVDQNAYTGSGIVMVDGIQIVEDAATNRMLLGVAHICWRT